jgi:3'-phosphoadenosine 5'-phosphosulfate (PAPS) 3'-phosphatase
VLDPIDGTRGFVGQRQYAVCLGMLQDGDVVLGVLGCPNLPKTLVTDADGHAGASDKGATDGAGCLFLAHRCAAAEAGHGVAAIARCVEPHILLGCLHISQCRALR